MEGWRPGNNDHSFTCKSSKGRSNHVTSLNLVTQDQRYNSIETTQIFLVIAENKEAEYNNYHKRE